MNGNRGVRTWLLYVFLGWVMVMLACRFGGRRNGDVPPATAAPVPGNQATVPTVEGGVISPLQFVTGRNEYIIEVDNTPRRFIVYVPTGYDPSRPTPVVVMCHGSNQHPENMYENTGWVDKAEEESFIVVFPASWKYPLLGEAGVHEKWNTLAMSQLVPAGTELKDDVKFMRVMLDYLKTTWNVDEERIFASGFSNGGGFVLTRLIPEMNDVFAAYSTAGAGLIGEVGVGEIPIHFDASLYSVLGTNDNKIAEGQELPVPFPFAAEEIVNDPVFGPMLQKTASLLNLEMSYTVESETDLTRFTFDQSLGGADNRYVFMMVRGIGHVYPSGDNNRVGINAADLFWAFFMGGDT